MAGAGPVDAWSALSREAKKKRWPILASHIYPFWVIDRITRLWGNQIWYKSMIILKDFRKKTVHEVWVGNIVTL